MEVKIKVAVITPGSFAIPDPRSSSVETVVNKITTSLQNDIDYTVFGKKTKNHPSTEWIGNIRYVRFVRSTSYIKKIISVLKKEKHDILQVENRPKYVKALRAAFPKATIYLSLHSITFIRPSVITKSELIDCFHAANKIIVNSYFLKNHLINQTNIESNKIFVNHLGVDTNQFKSKWLPEGQKKVDKFKRNLNLQNQNILLYVGRLLKIKGVHHILHAMPEIIRQSPNTILYIIGNAFAYSDRRTKYVDELYDLAAEVQDHVRFLPFIPHNEVHEWFQIADVMLVPSASKEAFGLVNVEAMASGTPVIATKAGGMPEIIVHGETGLLVDPNNIEQELPPSILELLSSKNKSREMGEKSVQRVLEHFTWEHSGSRLLGLYKKTV